MASSPFLLYICNRNSTPSSWACLMPRWLYVKGDSGRHTMLATVREVAVLFSYAHAFRQGERDARETGDGRSQSEAASEYQSQVCTVG